MPSRPLFNLIVTHEPGYENYVLARAQIRDILGSDMRVVDTSQSIMLLRVSDPFEAVRRISEELPGSTPVLRVVPVEEVVEPTVQRVAGTVERLASKIPEGETFKIRIDGHLYDDKGGVWERVSRREAIDVIAERVDRPVNLSEPQWLVYVKVVRLWRGDEFAAVVVARPDQIFSTHGRGG